MPLISFIFIFFYLQALHSLKLYVSYNETNFTCQDSQLRDCGTLQMPFVSILQTFFYMDYNYKNISSFPEISLMLMSENYIIDENNATYYLDLLNEYYGKTDIVWNIFNRFNDVKIILTPEENSNKNRKVNISVKTLRCSFVLNSTIMEFNNLLFDGYDLSYNYLEFPNQLPCFYWKIGCCLYETEMSELFELPSLCNYHVFSSNYYIGNPMYFFQIFSSSFLYISSCKFIKFGNYKRFWDLYFDGFLYDFSNIISEIHIFDSDFLDFTYKTSMFAKLIGKNFYFPFGSGMFNLTKCTFTNIKMIDSISVFSLNFYQSIKFKSVTFIKTPKLFSSDYNMHFSLEDIIIFAEDQASDYKKPKAFISIYSYSIEVKNMTIRGNFLVTYLFNLTGNVMLESVLFDQLVFDNSGIFKLDCYCTLIIQNSNFSIKSINDKSVPILLLIGLNIFKIQNSFIKTEIPLRVFDFYKIKLIKMINVNLNYESEVLNFEYSNLAEIESIIISNCTIISSSFNFLKQIKIIFIHGSYFSTNKKTSNVMLYFEQNNKIILKDCIFEKIKTKFSGSSISLNENNILILIRTRFDDINCYEGGCVLYANSNNFVRAFDIIITNIHSNDKGAVLLVFESNWISFIKVIAQNFSTINSGGFLNAVQQNNSLNFLQIQTFDGFSDIGAFCYLHLQNTFVIRDSILVRNQVFFEAGCLYANVLNFIVIQNLTVLNSFSNEISGIFSCIDRNTVVISGSYFKNSSSYSAGAFQLKNSNIFLLKNCSISNTQAKDIGGLFKIFLKNTIIIKQSEISMISAELKGGNFYLENQNVLILISVIIQNNTCKSDFLFASDMNTIIVHRVFFENKNLNEFDKAFNLYRYNNKLILSFCKFSQFYANSLIFTEKTTFIKLLKLDLKFLILRDYLLNCQLNTSIIFSNVSYDARKNLLSQINSKAFLINSSILIVNSNFYEDKIEYSVNFGSFISTRIFITNCLFHNLKKPFEDLPNFQLIHAYLSFLIIDKSRFFGMKIYLNTTQVRIKQSSFLFGRFGALTIEGNINNSFNFVSVYIYNSIFLANKNPVNGGAIYLNCPQIYCSLKLIRSNFILNRAVKGGVIHINYLDRFIVYQNKFQFNKACESNVEKVGKGGVFYFIANNFSFYFIQNNYFFQNQAEVGGLFFIQSGFPFIDSKTFLMNNIVLKNKATYYGDEFATLLNKISKSREAFSQENLISIYNLVSGKTYEDCLAKVYAYDGYDNLGSINEKILTSILSFNSLNNNNWIQRDGYLCFSQYFKNDRILQPSFSQWSNITLNFKHENKVVISSSVFVAYYFRNCIIGEKLSDDFRCTECPKNFYSFEKNVDQSTVCKVCSQELGFYCFGGNNITIKQYFWRKSNNSSLILYCPNPNSCLGDNRLFKDSTEYAPEFSQHSCDIGYIDPLCAVCDRSYGNSGKYYCSDCFSFQYIFKSIFLTLVQCLFMIYTLYKCFKTSLFLYAGESQNESRISMELLKLLTFHVQSLIIIFSLNSKFIGVKSVFEISPLNTNLSDSFSFKCVFDYFGWNSSYYYSKLLVSILTPLVIFALFMVLIKLCLLKEEDSIFHTETLNLREILKKLSLYQIVKFITMVTLSLQSSNILRDCFDALIYVNIDDSFEKPDFRLISDYSIIYDSESHLKIKNFFVIPCIFLVGILLPLCIIYQIIKKKKQCSLEDKENLFLYGYFSYSYHRNALFWEWTLSFRRIFLLAMTSFSQMMDFYGNGLLISLLSVLLTFISLLHLLNKIQPYKYEFKTLMVVEEASLIILIVSIIFSIPLFLSENKIMIIQPGIAPNFDPNLDNDTFKKFLTIIIFISNGIFYLIFAYFYYKKGDIQNRLKKFIPKSLLNSTFLSTMASKMSKFSKEFSKTFKSSVFMNEEDIHISDNKNNADSKNEPLSPAFKNYLKTKNRKIKNLEDRIFKNYVKICMLGNPLEIQNLGFMYLSLETQKFFKIYENSNMVIKIKHIFEFNICAAYYEIRLYYKNSNSERTHQEARINLETINCTIFLFYKTFILK